MTMQRVPFDVILVDDGGELPGSALADDSVAKAALASDVESAVDKAAALPAQGNADNAGQVIGFDASGNYQSQAAASGGGGVALSSATPEPVGSEAVGDDAGAAHGDHGHGWANIPMRNIPETLQIISREYSAGGDRLLTDGSIQIAGDLQGSALGAIDVGADWTAEVLRTQDTAAGANPWIQARFRISDYAALPAASALGDIRFSPVDAGDPDAPAPEGTVMAIVSRATPSDDTTNTYHYAFVQIGIANWPAGDYVRLLRLEDARYDFPVHPDQMRGGRTGQYMRWGASAAEWGTAPAATGGEPDWTTILDYNPAAPVQLTSNTLWECPTAIAPALTADDDDHFLNIEVMLSEGSADVSNREVWSISEFVRAGDYRSGGNTPAGSVSPQTVVWGFTDGAVSVDSNAAHWTRLVVAKGPNGRIALMPMGRGCYVQRVLVRLVEIGGGGSDGQTGQQLVRSPGNELLPGTVGIEQLTDVLRARLDPEYRIQFISGLGEVLWVFGSPAQGDALENNDPASSYEPQDPNPQIPPLLYDRSAQSAHPGRLGYVLSFGADTERQADPRFGAGGTVNNELRMGVPTLANDESLFLFGEFIHRGAASLPIFTIATNAAGTTGWTLWSNGTTGRIHVAEADGTEYGNITPAGGAGLAGQLVRYGFQVDKTAVGYQLALQINGVDVAMSNPSTNPVLHRLSYGWFPGTRFDGQMPIAGAIKAAGAALGIPAGATGQAETALANPFGISRWQYSVTSGEFEYVRAWSDNLIDSDVVLVNTNEPYITLNKSFDISAMDEIRLDIQYYSSERASVHSYLEGLTTRTLAAPNTILLNTWAFEWERGKSPSQYFRGGLSNRSNAQYGAYVRPIVNGDICTGLSFRNFSNNGDTLTVRGIYVR